MMADLNDILDVIGSTGVVQDMSKFDSEKTFKENGVDSLDAFTIYLAVEEKFEVKLSEEELLTAKTAVSLLQLVEKKLGHE